MSEENKANDVVLENNSEEANKPDNNENIIEEQENFEVKLRELNEKYLRTLAEFDNARKRFDKMQSDITKYAVSDFARELLSVQDVFNKALDGIKEEEIEDSSMKNFVVGIKLTHRELERLFSKFGVISINPLGEKFDPNYHETLYSKADSEKENGTICEVIEMGYKIHDRLLRSAKVGIITNS